MKNQTLSPRLTRRQLAAAVLASAAAAQTPPAAAPVPPSTPDGELQAAREQNQRTAETLSKTPVPVETEPAFHFTV